jgi:phage tail sheath protein FI
MAEYLAPGMYVEEFEPGVLPVEGISTSTAGFVGLAQKGMVEGIPRLVTSFAEFKRSYGEYLSENEYGDYRFLAYAVEHFFINGGSSCFVMRVAPADAKCSAKKAGVLQFTAKNPGAWGDNICIKVTGDSKAKTQIKEMLKKTAKQPTWLRRGLVLIREM